MEPFDGPIRLEGVLSRGSFIGPGTVAARGRGDVVGERKVDFAFVLFHRAHHERLSRALVVAIGDRALGLEAADEAMTRAYERWPSVATMENPAGWCYRVGLNWATSVRRRRQREHLGPDIPEVSERHRPGLDPDVERALGQLPQAQRAVVVARHLLGFSTEATADALGIATGTVKSRLSRALVALRTELEADDG
jgi:DNA-directed RNA polymerase specialized sigma24 family protein